MEYDGHSRIKSLIALDVTENAGGIVQGNIIDTVDFESVEFILFTGTSTSGDHFADLQVSDTGAFAGEENAVDLDDIIGSLLTLLENSNQIRRFGYIGKKRFLRLALIGSNNPDQTVGVVAILGRPRSMPVADQ